MINAAAVEKTGSYVEIGQSEGELVCGRRRATDGDLAAAVTALNHTRYGLSSSVYTRDVNTAFRAMRDFQTGIVYVNAGTIGAETHLPFGGWKERERHRRTVTPRSTRSPSGRPCASTSAAGS